MSAIVSDKAIGDLGFDRIRSVLGGLCHSDRGRELAQLIEPTADLDELRSRRTLHEQARRLTDRAGRPDLQCPDLRPALVRLSRGEPALEPAWLLEVASAEEVVRQVERLKSACDRTQDRELLDRLEALREHSGLITRIHKALAPDGSILDSASSHLARLRSELMGARQKIQGDLLQFLRANADAGQEQVITERNGRFVVPIKSDQRGRVDGLVHDYSSSRRTAFMEPTGFVRDNNRIQELIGEEREECQRILRELTDEVRRESKSIERNGDELAALDAVFAIAQLAIRQSAELCAIGEDEIRLLAARHPLLGRDCIPIDLLQPPGTRLLLISGPNGGGKTVALKTLGLLVLMQQSGLGIPVGAGSVLMLFERIAVDIGDPQQLGSDSTYTGHLRNQNHLLAEAGPNWLVLLDEVGSGTDPEEGGALGTAVLEGLVERGARVVATTHLLRVKTFAHTQAWATLASTELDPQTHAPTFRLIYGVPGRSSALQIAENLGFPAQTLEVARARLQSGQIEFENLIRELESAREELRAARANAEKEQDQAALAKRQYELKRSQGFAEGLEEFRSESSELLVRLRDLASRAPGELGKGEMRRVESQIASLTARARPTRAKHVQAAQPSGPRGTVSRGDQVLVAPLGVRGEVLELDEKRGIATVQGPRFAVTANLKDLQWLAPGAARIRQEPSVEEQRPEKFVSMEIDLRGNRVEEGLELTQRYLSDASLSGLPSVRIIHGMGTGRLRAAIQEMLKKHPLVLSYRDGGEGEGGLGVTVAKLSE